MTRCFSRFLTLGLGLLALASVGRPAESSRELDEAMEALDLRAMPKNSKKPKGIKQGPPIYPYEMSRAGIIGSVIIEFIIDKTGDVRNAHVVQSNNPWFERPALDAVMAWKFAPGEVDGKPVNTRVSQLIEFNLEPVAGRELELWKITKGKDHDKLPPEYQWEQPPMPKTTQFPVYPFEQLKAGTAGKARVAYVVGPKGTVLAAKVTEATAPEFGAAVMAMIDGWQFKPAKLKDGKPGFARLATEYEFKPGGRADVPVSDEARAILKLLEKKPEAIVRFEDLDRAPKPVSQRPPVYPSALKEAGQEGNAVIEFYVDKQGDVQLPRIVSSTAPEFGYAAVQAVATWRFQPATKAGKPVIVRARIPVGFNTVDRKADH